MTVPWSQQIQQRYQCVLAEDLCEWFDSGIWKHADDGCGQRFLQAVAPQDLLEPAPQAIWPALMPCDLLPIISNGLGDYLCMRMGPDNSIREYVHWYHGGGDWIPWGKTLAEALLFDSIRQNLPGGQRDHAFAAAIEHTLLADDVHPIDRWTRQWLKNKHGVTLGDRKGHEIANTVLELGIAEAAVRCQLCIAALENPLLHELDDPHWRMIPPDQRQRYLFDCGLLPGAVIESIPMEPSDLCAAQDWDAVAANCEQVTNQRDDLAWAWDLWGYSFERLGLQKRAIDCYRRSLRCSIFTDQTVRVRTHTFVKEGQKFSATRLMQLEYQSNDTSEQAYLQCLACPKPDERRKLVREYFSDLAASANGSDAHDYWVKAGWDLGAEPMTAYGDLLTKIETTAAEAGRMALSAIAQTHRQCFKDRYGL
ncbi:SMI1/KNR4 family protein [Stieleria sp. JC731]|nr:SMI1/KNR4 family protein [Stieleria sp. JC731]